MFSIELKGDFSLQNEIRSVYLQEKQLKKDFIAIGKDIYKDLINFIKANTKTSNSSQVHLIKEIDYEINDNAFFVSFAIGNIANLDNNAPWWYIINYGGTHPRAGKFTPGGWSGKSTFTYDPGSKTGMFVKPGTVIKPMNYIQHAEVYGLDAYRRLATLLNIQEG